MLDRMTFQPLIELGCILTPYVDNSYLKPVIQMGDCVTSTAIDWDPFVIREESPGKMSK
jgi:hypothetical protein